MNVVLGTQIDPIFYAVLWSFGFTDHLKFYSRVFFDVFARQHQNEKSAFL
jgi:hypothetical protein